MGWLERLRGGGGERRLAQAEECFAGGELGRAIELAERVASRAEDSGLAARAQALARRARDARAEASIAKAQASQDEGFLEDAVEWLLGALEDIPEEAARAPVRRRLDRLEKEIAERGRRRARLSDPEAEDGGLPGDGPETLEIEPDMLYDTLVAMLREDLAEAYAERPEAFRHAYVELNEGDAAGALRAFEALAAESGDPGAGDDPILRFELGRARLATGAHGDARADFEAVWPVLGEEPIEASGSMSVPVLWADAALAGGDAEGVVDRLETLAVSSRASAELAERFGEALLAAGRLDEAADYLASASAIFPAQAALPRLEAEALARAGQRERAIERLERAVAPSCVGGCSRSPMHLPSMRLLISLRLDDERSDPARAGELLELVAYHARRLSAEDHRQRARYYRRLGDSEAAEAAEVAAAGAANGTM